MDVFVSVVGENLIALWALRVLKISFDPVRETVVMDDVSALEQLADRLCLFRELGHAYDAVAVVLELSYLGIVAAQVRMGR